MKMSVRKVRDCGTLSASLREPDNIDSLIRQAMEKETFLSLSRSGDSPAHLIQLLHAFDQQGSDKVSKSSNGDSCDELKENSDKIFNGVNSFFPGTNGIKDPMHSLKSSESNTKGSKCATAQMASRKIPEAVVAFAQAAAKATGEPEKSNLPGWPLLSPSKTQLQKCDNCSREFCSSINFRRHRRVHRRSLNVDKDFQKNRDLLGTFWDKLSVDEAKEIVSLNNATVEEVTGSSVVKALSTWFRRAGLLSSLPQRYIKAGLTLSDIVQASPSMPHISSQELFSVLDEASEKTFLCAGTALSLQKYVFDGEAMKRALEIKNIVACTSFLIEIQLVKAWLIHKDAEALRCQKLLVDEEEAAQKRQAELSERKRKKKLRQKGHKIKASSSNGDKIDFKDPSIVSPDRMGSTDASSSRDSCEDNTSEASHNHENRSSDFVQSSAAEDEANACKIGIHNTQIDGLNTANYGNSSNSAFHAADPEQAAVSQTQAIGGHMQPSSWHIRSRLTQNNPNSAQSSLVLAARPLVNMRHNNPRDSKVATRSNSHKVWTIKSKPENEDGRRREETMDQELANQPVVSNRNEILIGSINVSLGDGALRHPNPISESQKQEKLDRPDSSQGSVSKPSVKLWRPVSRNGNGHSIQNDPRIPAAKDAELLLPQGSCQAFEGIVFDLGKFVGPITYEAAKAFLAQRWKEAIARDQTLWVISSPTDTEASLGGNLPSQSSDFHERLILGRVENRLDGTGAVDSASTSSSHFKARPKAEKTSKLKYVPKQKI